MRFSLDDRSPAAHRAERWLLAAVPLGVVAFPLLERALAPGLGGIWSVLVAITGVGGTLAGMLRMSAGGCRPRQAAVQGMALGVGMALLYAWVFGAPWVSLAGA